MTHCTPCPLPIRKKMGKSSYCRPLVNCSKACVGVTNIDVVDAADMTRAVFAATYAHRGQPLVVRNATQVGTFTLCTLCLRG